MQFQKDEQLYERVFAESSLYFYRNRPRFNDWQAVVIYPSRSVEQSSVYPHRSLLNGEQVHRVYLDELGDIRSLPLGIALMVLTTLNKTQAPEEARYLLNRTRQEVPQPTSRAIIEMITTIIAYKFEQLNRTEVESMLGLALKKTRLYQDIKEEGQQEEAANLTIRQLTKRFGELPQQMHTSISGLSLPVLQDLSEALLDFTSLAELQAWLEMQSND